MQFGLLAVLSTAAVLVVRRMTFFRRCGWPGAAHRLYRRASWLTGGGIWCAMLLQEWVLWRSGQLTWQTGLPLHLCSMMGVLALPMLLTENRLLWHFALYAGMPGALLALIFPAVLDTPWPELTQLGFHSLHALLFLSPLLPLGLGKQPEGAGVLHAWIILLGAGCAVMVVNGLLGSNYLFLAGPAPVAPMLFLAQKGIWLYRLALVLLSALVIGAQGIVMYRLSRCGFCKVPVKSHRRPAGDVYNRQKI